MNRDVLIAAAMDAAQNIDMPSRPIFDDDDERSVIAAVFAVEPLIRADERADLRAKVEALLVAVPNETVGDWSWNRALREVLALIDGAGS